MAIRAQAKVSDVSDCYMSFLVRLWRDRAPEPAKPASGWQGEVEHIQSGRRWQSDSLEEVFRCLRHQVAALEGKQP